MRQGHDLLPQHLAERLGNDPGAVDALHALGFGTLVVTEYSAGRICLHYAVRLSSLTLHVKLLAQEIALLRTELDARDEPPR